MADDKQQSQGERRASRARSGARHFTTLSRRRTYRLHGQIYSRLLFMRSDPQQVISAAGTVPLRSENLFEREAITQMEIDDYAMKEIELKLKQGRRLLETNISHSDGSFKFTTPLRPGQSYRLEAKLLADRVYPERVGCIFLVKKLPEDPLGHLEVRVRTLHHIDVNYAANPGREHWVQVDREMLSAHLTGGAVPVLSLSGKASLVFDTFALDVPYLSQHRHAPGGGVRYHAFQDHGQRYRIALEHLCLATCTAMILRYYGVRATVEQVAEHAARYYLDIRAGRRPAPPGPLKRLHPSAGDLVQFEDSSYPHNEGAFVAYGVAPLLNRAPAGSRSFERAGTDNLMKNSWPKLTCLVGNGWPVTLGDDLSGNYEHGRVCHGLVVDHRGKIVRAYGNDPYNEGRWEIKTDGSQTDLGWVLMGRAMDQQEICTDRLSHGGDVPAPKRGKGP